ncbi:MAG: TIGR00269 family protein [Candidatus Micrarchaeia archaeon]
MKCSNSKNIPAPNQKTKCIRCKNNSDIYLPYAGQHLCRRHFLELFEKRFKKTNREFSFIKKGDKICLALSGGKDSTTLLHLLSKFRKEHPFELFAITIDSGIHCDYWKKTMKIAKEHTKSLGIKHYLFSYKNEFGFTLNEFVDKLKIENPCSYCGVFRRYILNKQARELGATKLAIGHNLDDAVQTLILNLTRNEPLRLLRFNEHLLTSPKLVPRIKPLIRIPEEEVIEYAKFKNLNLEPKSCCPYSKYAMRNSARKVVDELELMHPGSKMKMFNSFVSIQKLMKKGINENEFSIGTCSKCSEPSSAKLCMCCRMLKPFGEKK